MVRSKWVRRSVALLIALSLCIFSYIPIAAEEEAHLSFMARDVYVNGLLINNYQLFNPLVVRQGSTYVPLSVALGNVLGFRVQIDEDRSLILLKPVDPVGETVREDDVACNLENQLGTLAEGYAVVVVDDFGAADADALAARWRRMADPVIWSVAGLIKALTGGKVDPTPHAEVLPLRESEILLVGDMPYIPLSAFRESGMFGWDAHYDLLTGLYISTDAEIPAKSYYSAENASYIAGRAAYIRSIRPELSEHESYYYEYLFRHEATVFGVDQDLLMAVSRTECSFQAAIVSPYGGTVGMMQILPRTAAAYGITEEQLKDPHVNLEFGARYIRDRLWIFSGDIIKALSAYNQGVVTVSRGEYKTGYAEKCLANRDAMRAWLSAQGYTGQFSEQLTPDVLVASTAETE